MTDRRDTLEAVDEPADLGSPDVTRQWRADLMMSERPPAGSADGTEGPTIPQEWCRLCWREKVICLDGHWWLQHIGSYSECTHPCHTDADSTFLGSTS